VLPVAVPVTREGIPVRTDGEDQTARSRAARHPSGLQALGMPLFLSVSDLPRTCYLYLYLYVCFPLTRSPQLHTRHNEHKPAPEKRLTGQRLYDRLAHFLPENGIVAADTGTAMYVCLCM
jgi:hypothetical protein